jgi:hypothetical protein
MKIKYIRVESIGSNVLELSQVILQVCRTSTTPSSTIFDWEQEILDSKEEKSIKQSNRRNIEKIKIETPTESVRKEVKNYDPLKENCACESAAESLAESAVEFEVRNVKRHRRAHSYY